MGKPDVYWACHRNLLCDVEKLRPLCQTGRARGKVKSGEAQSLSLAVAKTRQAMAFLRVAPGEPVDRK